MNTSVLLRWFVYTTTRTLLCCVLATVTRISSHLIAFVKSQFFLHTRIKPLTIFLYSLQGFDSCLHFAHAGLMWLEEQSVHVRELHLVVVKQQQLEITEFHDVQMRVASTEPRGS